MIFIQCNYKNLEYFKISTMLSWQRTSCREFPSLWAFIIGHSKNISADRSSRKLNNEIYYPRLMVQHPAILAVTTITQSYGHLLNNCKATQELTLWTQKYNDPWLMFQSQMSVNGGSLTMLRLMRGEYMCPWYSAVEWPAITITLPNQDTSESSKLLSSY